MAGNFLCRSGWPEFHRDPPARIKDVCHHAGQNQVIFPDFGVRLVLNLSFSGKIGFLR